MSIVCSKCKKPAVTFIRYNGTHLCREHFIQYFKRRVKKDIKKQGKTGGNSIVGVAVSGGKDSVVALHIVHEIFSSRKTVKIVAISVDEGIKGYRDKSIEIAKRNCRKLGVDHYIISFKEIIGSTLDEIISSKKDEIGACSYCGVFRRQCLNLKAKELGVTKLVTGHNLDDVAQSALMNFVNGDVKKLARMGPHMKIQPGLIPRMLPLRVIPEKENALFALLEGIEYHDDVCPYASQALRGMFRDIIDELEYRNPGTRHSILNSYNIIKDLLLNHGSSHPVHPCRNCGEPTSHELCKACILKEKLR